MGDISSIITTKPNAPVLDAHNEKEMLGPSQQQEQDNSIKMGAKDEESSTHAGEEMEITERTSSVKTSTCDTVEKAPLDAKEKTEGAESSPTKDPAEAQQEEEEETKDILDDNKTPTSEAKNNSTKESHVEHLATTSANTEDTAAAEGKGEQDKEEVIKSEEPANDMGEVTRPIPAAKEPKPSSVEESKLPSPEESKPEETTEVSKPEETAQDAEPSTPTADPPSADDADHKPEESDAEPTSATGTAEPSKDTEMADAKPEEPSEDAEPSADTATRSAEATSASSPKDSKGEPESAQAEDVSKTAEIEPNTASESSKEAETAEDGIAKAEMALAANTAPATTSRGDDPVEEESAIAEEPRDRVVVAATPANDAPSDTNAEDNPKEPQEKVRAADPPAASTVEANQEGSAKAEESSQEMGTTATPNTRGVDPPCSDPPSASDEERKEDGSTTKVEEEPARDADTVPVLSSEKSDSDANDEKLEKAADIPAKPNEPCEVETKDLVSKAREEDVEETVDMKAKSDDNGNEPSPEAKINAEVSSSAQDNNAVAKDCQADALVSAKEDAKGSADTMEDHDDESAKVDGTKDTQDKDESTRVAMESKDSEDSGEAANIEKETSEAKAAIPKKEEETNNDHDDNASKGTKSDGDFNSDDEGKTDEEQDEKSSVAMKSGGESISDEETKSDGEGTGTKKRPPLHRLMVDYKVRKEQTIKENLENARKSGRQKKQTDMFVAEPACVFLNPEKQRLKRRLKQMQQQQQLKVKNKRRKMTQALEKTKSSSEVDTKDDGKRTEPTTADALEISSHETASEPNPDVVGSKVESSKRTSGGNESATELPSVTPERAIEKSTRILTSDSSCDRSQPNGESSGQPETSQREPEATQLAAQDLYYPHAMDVQMECQGKKFPEQLMLMMTRKVAEESLWWSSEGQGTTFIIDCAWFRDCVMRAFFPNNPFRRITHTLKRWGFQRNYLDLPEGIMAFYHPLFQRDKPELASTIVCPEQKHFKTQIKKLPENGKTDPEPPTEVFARRPLVSHSVRNAPDHEKQAEKRRRKLAVEKYEYEKKRHEARLLQRRSESVARPAARGCDVPPSVRIASLRRESSTASRSSNASREPPAGSAQRISSPERHEHQPRRTKRDPDVVDLTDDTDDQDATGARHATSGRMRDVPPYPSPRPPTQSAGKKRKLNVFDEVRSAKYRPASLHRHSSVHSDSSRSSQRSRDAPHTPQHLARAQRNSFVTPESQGHQGRCRPMEIPQRMAHQAAEERRLQHHAMMEQKRIEQMNMAKAYEEERALRLQKQSLQEELARSRERIAEQQLQQEAERLVAQDEEEARRRRLASALYGSGRTERKKPKPAPKPVPRSREPPASREIQPRSAEPSAASARAPCQRPPVPPTPPTQVELARRPDPALAAQADLLAAAMQDQALLAQQQNLLANPLAGLLRPPQQDLALSGLLGAAAGFAPPALPQTQPTLEELLLLHSLQR